MIFLFLNLAALVSRAKTPEITLSRKARPPSPVADKDLVSAALCTSLRSSTSVPNPLHVFEQNLLPAAVIQFPGSAIGVAGDPLGRFKGAVVFQKIRNAGRSKRVGRIVSRQSGLLKPTL